MYAAESRPPYLGALPVLTIHYWNFYALLVAIVIHITGVVVTELREGGGIVSAMFTGQKVFDQEPRDDVGARM